MLFRSKQEPEPGVPYVLYTILALDFLIPTIIFLINECTSRIEASSIKEGQFSSLEGDWVNSETDRFVSRERRLECDSVGEVNRRGQERSLGQERPRR